MDRKYAVIGLDAWGTLLYPPAQTDEQLAYTLQPLQEILAENGVVFPSVRACYQAYSTAKNNSERLSERTGRHIGPLERRLIFAEEQGLNRDTLDMTAFAAASDEMLRRQERIPVTPIEPNIAKTLAAVHERGISVGVVSNLGNISARYMREQFSRLGIGPQLDYELYSDEIGLCKPNPAIFRLLARAAGCSVEDILFIGDNLQADVVGPMAIGIDAVHITDTPSEAPWSAPDVTAALHAAGVLA